MSLSQTRKHDAPRHLHHSLISDCSFSGIPDLESQKDPPQRPKAKVGRPCKYILPCRRPLTLPDNRKILSLSSGTVWHSFALIIKCTPGSANAKEIIVQKHSSSPFRPSRPESSSRVRRASHMSSTMEKAFLRGTSSSQDLWIYLVR